MKKVLFILIIGLVFAPALFGATPSPSPSPTATPVGFESPTPIPSPSPAGYFVYPRQIELYYDFTVAVTDQKLTKAADHLTFTVDPERRFYIYAIGWSCQSALNGRLEWDTTPNDRLGLPVNFVVTGQGYTFSGFDPPLSSDVMGASPILTTDAASQGTVWVAGVEQ